MIEQLNPICISNDGNVSEVPDIPEWLLRFDLLPVLESHAQPELTGGIIATSSPSLIIKSDARPSSSTST